jgi:hypothetical protein
VLAKDSEQFLSPWMKDILMSELNVLAVEEVIKLSTGANMKSNASTDDKLQIALDAELTAELTEAGLLREVVRTIQSVRKAAGCQLGDKVVIEYDTPDDALETLIETRKEEIKEAVSATNMTKGGGAEVRKVNDYELRLGVKKDI